MKRKNNHGNYTNPCLTMHQPWASLLVYGIKRIEGRSWPAPITGRLWIHAASKLPDEATIKAMEDFYREVYAVNGITDLKFPEHYPVSRLLGCVEVVGCVRREELACWEAVPEGVRLEGQTDFCWLCEQPQKLLVPFEMRGYQRVYNLEKKIYEAAIRGLTPVQCPLPVKFPLPNSKDPFSLRPGSISVQFSESKANEVEKSSSLSVAIAGARLAATQFSKKDQNFQRNTIQNESALNSSTRTGQPMSKYLEEGETLFGNFNEVRTMGIIKYNKKQQSSPSNYGESSYMGKTSVVAARASKAVPELFLNEVSLNNFSYKLKVVPNRKSERPPPPAPKPNVPTHFKSPPPTPVLPPPPPRRLPASPPSS